MWRPLGQHWASVCLFRGRSLCPQVPSRPPWRAQAFGRGAPGAQRQAWGAGDQGAAGPVGSRGSPAWRGRAGPCVWWEPRASQEKTASLPSPVLGGRTVRNLDGVGGSARGNSTGTTVTCPCRGWGWGCFGPVFTPHLLSGARRASLPHRCSAPLPGPLRGALWSEWVQPDHPLGLPAVHPWSGHR